MGYATERHRAAIEIHGPASRLHRLSFAPFRLVEAEEAMAEADLLELDMLAEAENEKAA